MDGVRGFLGMGLHPDRRITMTTWSRRRFLGSVAGEFGRIGFGRLDFAGPGGRERSVRRFIRGRHHASARGAALRRTLQADHVDRTPADGEGRGAARRGRDLRPLRAGPVRAVQRIVRRVAEDNRRCRRGRSRERRRADSSPAYGKRRRHGFPAHRAAQPGIPTISTQSYFDTMARATASAVKEALGRLRRVTEIGTGMAVVDRVASSRRLRQPDGSIVVRSSSAKDPALRALPEGLIDPQLRTLSLCDGGAPLVQIHYYATHPQSFYGDGRVSYDVPGMARERLEKESGVPQVYFTGCGGNVAMGKYNDGSRQARQALTDRLYDAMARSSRRMTRAGRAHPLEDGPDTAAVAGGGGILRAHRARVVADKNAAAAQRIKDAMLLAWIDRIRAGRPVTVSGMALGPVRLVNLPGEVFVEYQLSGAAGGSGEVRRGRRLWGLRDQLRARRCGLPRPWRLRADLGLRRPLREAVQGRHGRGDGRTAGRLIRA